MDDLRPPRDNIVRAIFPGPEMRASADGGMPTLHGHFAVFDQWTRISSAMEGTFMERIAPGAFAKTFAENGANIKVLLNHGKDPQVGDKPLGGPPVLREDASGASYEVPLIDTSYNRDIIPALEAGLYGASFRFSVVKEDFEAKPTRSASNPDGIPERTVREAKVYEFGPVTFPAYVGASAGVRSMTDEYAFDRLTGDRDRLQALVGRAAPSLALDCCDCCADTAACDCCNAPNATCQGGACCTDQMSSNALQPTGAERIAHSDVEPPVSTPPTPPKETPVTTVNRADRPARITELKSELERIGTEYSGVLPADVEVRWTDATVELNALIEDEKADAKRHDLLKSLEARGSVESEPAYTPTSFSSPKPPVVRDIYNLAEIRNASRSPEDEKQLIRDSAFRAIEAASFPQMDRATGQARVEATIRATEEEDQGSYVARRILLTGKPAYRRALRKTLTGQMLNVEEMTAYDDFQKNERAMGQVTGSAGGFGVTFDLDPTMVQTSSGAIVPYRRAARVVTTTTNEWRGVTSGGVVAAYAAEAAVGTDNSPTLAQPAALVQKAHCFVPFSMELQGDYSTLEAELAREIQDAKDVLEATQFTTGAGTTVFPQGIVTGSTVAQNLATTGVVAAQDLYNTEVALNARFRVHAAWFANRMFYNRIRAIDTAGGAQLFTPNLTVGLERDFAGNTGYTLLGYPANECSGFTTTLTGAGNKIAVFGDPNYFVIVDRVGLNLELVPILTQQATAGTGFGIPTGQRGVYAWWRNTAKVLSATAFLTVTTV